MITLSLRCWLWARKRLVRPGPACVQPSWGAFVRADLPREVVGRALGGREPAKMLLLSPTYRRDVVEGASSPSVGLWLPVERLATSGVAPSVSGARGAHRQAVSRTKGPAHTCLHIYRHIFIMAQLLL